MGLTELQKKLLAFIDRHREKKGYPPNWREICEEFGWKSTGAVSFHITPLKAGGFLDFTPRGNRTLHLTERGYRALRAS